MPGPTPVDDLIVALAASEQKQTLFGRLEEILVRLHAVPAILYVRHGERLLPAAGFDCSGDVEAIAIGDLAEGKDPGLPASRVVLTWNNEVTGLLAVFGKAADDPALRRAVAVVAVTLRHLAREEAMARELHHANDQAAHLVVAGSLLQHLDVEVLLVKILEAVLGALRASSGAVLIIDAGNAEAHITTWGMRERAVRQLKFADGEQLSDKVLRDGPLCMGRDQLRSGLVGEAPAPNLGGLLALPLVTHGHGQGLVLLGQHSEFTPAQRRMAESLATFASLALDNAVLVQAKVDNQRLVQELAIARTVQEAMYPLAGITVGPVQVEGSSRPCQETGGDYYTFCERAGKVLCVVGDVSGHGLGAALFATMAHAILQPMLHGSGQLLDGLRQVNSGLFHAQNGRFITLAAVEIDPETGLFTYVSAGHTPLLWLNHGTSTWLESTGMPLGIMPDSPLTQATQRQMAPGDYLLLYTDGITEANNALGEAYGEVRLAAAASQGWSLGLGPTELMMLINAEVDAWTGGKAHGDDLTMVVVALRETWGS